MDTKRNWLDILNPKRRSFLKTVGAGAAVATTSGLVELGLSRNRGQFLWKDKTAFAVQISEGIDDGQ